MQGLIVFAALMFAALLILRNVYGLGGILGAALCLIVVAALLKGYEVGSGQQIRPTPQELFLGR